MSNQETKKALSIVDRSTKALNAAAENVQKVVSELATTSALATALATDIEFKQSELESLEDKFAVKERELTAELKLKVKEDADKVLEGLLKERNLMAVQPSEHYSLQQQVRDLQEGNEAEVQKAIKQVEANLADAQKAEIARVNSAHQVEIATLKANEAALRERLAFYETQVSQLQGEIRAERETRIEIAKAESQKQAVTVNTVK